MFPDIKIKDTDIFLARKLKKDLKWLKSSIMEFSPPDFNIGKLNRLRIRIFKFPKSENCSEFFFIHQNKKYVCLNSSLLHKRYYTGLQYLIHGIAHSFSHFKEEIADEVFCEFVSYSVLKRFLEVKGEKYSRRILKSVMNQSSKQHNSLYRVGRRLEKIEANHLLKLNSRIKNNGIPEKNILSRLLKSKKTMEKDNFEKIPELEKGFRKA